MSSAKRDFELFVEWLHLPVTQAPKEVRQLSNLVLSNFSELSQTTRHRSQRSACLVKHARNLFAQTPDGHPEIQSMAVDSTWPWQRLRSMTIGPFRGFRTPEPFDLTKRVILFYGPNGSGKTSFCEGLEYSLLGSVEEAESKRIDGRTYLANIHAQRFEPPTLRATDNQNQEVVVSSSSDTFRFCFIEKNRIDAFSRIAARPPAERTELIATLFGMDKFNEFVNHFNESIDQQLVLTPAKQLTLNAKRNALAIDQETINGEARALLDLANNEAELALTYSADMTYEGVKALIGTTKEPGRLKQLEGILNAVPQLAIGLSREGLLSAFKAFRLSQTELTNIAAKLMARSCQVSFKDLYTAVLALQVTEGNHCPACDTPLSSTKFNPFERASAGLEQLKELGKLQENLKTAEGTMARAPSAACQPSSIRCEPWRTRDTTRPIP